MLDDTLKSQLQTYLGMLRAPIRLIASLDDSETGVEMRSVRQTGSVVPVPSGASRATSSPFHRTTNAVESVATAGRAAPAASGASGPTTTRPMP